MMNEPALVPKESVIKTPQLKKSSRTPDKKDILLIPPVKEKNEMPPPSKEIPVSKWNMPPEPDGYIHGNDNDCL